jgi:hypothetical protein
VGGGTNMGGIDPAAIAVLLTRFWLRHRSPATGKLSCGVRICLKRISRGEGTQLPFSQLELQVFSLPNMSSWTHLIRFVALEDHEVHLGQLVDTAQDVGLSTLNNVEVKAYLIQGTIFNNVVTKHILTVKQVSGPSFVQRKIN